jgi:transcriptional regulator with GAF, ATPase, and Fis domain
MDAPHFTEARKAFVAAGGNAQWHGLNLLSMLATLCKLIDASPDTEPTPAKPRMMDTLIAPVEPEHGLSRWQTAEKRLMQWALERHAYRQNLAAKFLDMPQSSFHDKARRYGITE